MGQSPFHGIFSALSQSQEMPERAEAKPSADPLPEPQEASFTQPTFTLPSSQQNASQVGRVAVDIFEQDGYYIIKAPIAGVRMSDLDIEIKDNVITIRGTRKQTDTAEEGQYYLRECYWGPFARSVTLPIQIDPRKVKATFNKECILKILIPKEDQVKVVKINEG